MDFYLLLFIDDNVGDACDDDFDGDKVKNEFDNCPNNSLIHQTDFRYVLKYFSTLLSILELFLTGVL